MNNMDVDTRPPPSWKPNFGFGFKKLANAMGGGSSAANSSNHCSGASSMHCWQPVADTSGVVDAPAASCSNGTLPCCVAMASRAGVPSMASSARFYGQPGCQGCATLQHRHEAEKAQLATQLAESEARSADLKQQVVSLQKQLDELKAFAAPLLAVNCVMGSLPSMCPGLLTDNKNCLGSGSYGTAHEWSLQNDTVVVKEIHLKKSSMENVAYEVGLTSLINHPNVVKSLGWWMGGRTSKQADAPVEACVLLMMEKCEGSLADCLDQGLFHHTDTLQPKDVTRLLEFAHGLCKAVAHIHELGVIHNDITVNNVFPKQCPQSGTSVAKLGDFGLSLPIPDGTYTGRSRGTPELSAPELLRDARCACHSRASDVYSLGGTLWELFTCRPWRWLNSNNQFEVNALYPHVPAAPSGLSELIVHMMAPNAAERPSMDAVLARMGQLLQQPIVPARTPSYIPPRVDASVIRAPRNHHPADQSHTAPKRAPPALPSAAKNVTLPDILPSKQVSPNRSDQTRLLPSHPTPSPVGLPAPIRGTASLISDDDSPMADAPEFNLLSSQPSDASTGEFLSYHPQAHRDGGLDELLCHAGTKHTPPHTWMSTTEHGSCSPAPGHCPHHASIHSPHMYAAIKSPCMATPHASPPSPPGCQQAASHASYIAVHRGRVPSGATSNSGGSGTGPVDLVSSGGSSCSVVKMPDSERATGLCAPMPHRPLDICVSELSEQKMQEQLPLDGTENKAAPLMPCSQQAISQFVNNSSSGSSSHSSCPSRDMFTV